MNKKIKVLFVGNSYTYFNDMPSTFFVNEATASGVDADVTSVTCGGAYLSQYADPENEQGKRLREIIKDKHYDFAVLQEQSINPIKNEEGFLSSVKALGELIDADKFILYATWGRNEGCPELKDLGLSRAEMTEKLSRAYNKAALKYGMSVAEVGKAFLSFEGERDELYNKDRSHPSTLGSAIAARVIFEATELFRDIVR